jgi:hypothetical protein
MLLNKISVFYFFICSLFFSGSSQSQSLVQSDWNESYTLQFGVDIWNLRPSISEDVFYGPYPSQWNASHSMLGLPSSKTTWNYSPVSPWYKFQGTISPLNNLKFSTKFQANQASGLKIDEISVDYGISEFLGVRAGIVDYKMSWCSTYETTSPWIYEPNTFCGMRYTATVTGGAPGAQTYFNQKLGEYRFQALAGVYQPNAFNYDNEEFGNYLLDGSPQKNTKNLKYGLSFNLLNVNNGTQLRLSWIHADQQAVTDLLSLGYQNSEMFYAGLEFYLAPKLKMRLTRTDHIGGIRIQDQFIPKESWNGALSNVHFSNTTIDVRYLIDQRNTLALAHTLYQFNIDNKDLPRPLVETYGTYSDGYFMLKRQQTSVSWRHDLDNGLFSIIQLSYTDLVNGYDGGRYKANAMTVGLRVGVTF